MEYGQPLTGHSHSCDRSRLSYDTRLFYNILIKTAVHIQFTNLFTINPELCAGRVSNNKAN